jgi:hypothetical protein
MRIFISYRRTDSTVFLVPEVRRVLSDVVGAKNVFLDIDNIPLGVDFRDHLREQIATTDAVLAVIGTNWEPERLADRRDFVRIELLAAHELGKVIVPVIAGVRSMPAESQLPEEFRWLIWRNAYPIAAPPRHQEDLHRLADYFRELLTNAEGSGTTPTYEAPSPPPPLSPRHWADPIAGVELETTASPVVNQASSSPSSKSTGALGVVDPVLEDLKARIAAPGPDHRRSMSDEPRRSAGPAVFAESTVRPFERQDGVADEVALPAQVSDVDGVNRTTEGQRPPSRRGAVPPRKLWLASACTAPIFLISLFVALRTPSKPTDPQAAQKDLARLVASDSATAETFVGSFVPQLSAKHEGSTGEDGELPLEGIFDDHMRYRRGYNAFLVLGDRYGLNREFDYMTFAPQPFETMEEANDWCVSNGLKVPTDCFGKQLKQS